MKTVLVHQEGVSEVVPTVVHGVLLFRDVGVPIHIAFFVDAEDNDVTVVVIVICSRGSAAGLDGADDKFVVFSYHIGTAVGTRNELAEDKVFADSSTPFGADLRELGHKFGGEWIEIGVYHFASDLVKGQVQSTVHIP